MADDELTNNGSDMDDSQPGIPGDEIVDGSGENAETAGEKEQEEITEPSMKEVESISEEKDGDEDQGMSLSPDEMEMISQMGGTQTSASNTETEEQTEIEDENQVSPMDFEQFSKSGQPVVPMNIDMLLDVTMPIAIELGRTAMPIHDILNLGPGSVVELNKLAGEPVDLLVNDKLIARGEVVVVDENFGIRITSMISKEDRIKSLG